MASVAGRAAITASRVERDEVDVGVDTVEEFCQAVGGFGRVILTSDEGPLEENALLGFLSIVFLRSMLDLNSSIRSMYDMIS